ncbi:type II secretion system F family protein [Desulfonatronovibrio magnus]|uniref:type II secretion system F family protein n=1 Tax=Desulfonatronovibrio magnus TaxID=698827 RepID=UPI0005EB2AC5|nr:type II secretion system F family protein [Desulfonatronovibrio magnus]
MPTYSYKALDTQGKTRKGYLESDSRNSAFRRLMEQQLTPVSLSQVREEVLSGKWKLKTLNPFKNSIRLDEAFYYLSMMLLGGGSLAQSLDILGRMNKGSSGRIWLDIRDSVESGSSFSKALMRHPKTFPSIYIGMIQVAEQSGKLGEILEKMAFYEEKRHDMKSRLITALSYPMIVVLIGIGAVYFLLSAVLPGVAGIFSATEQELPLSTRLLLSTGHWLDTYGLPLFMTFICLFLIIRYCFRKYPALKFRRDSLIWKIPLARNSILADFSSLLSFQLKSGISLVQAMNSASKGAGSLFFQKQISEASSEVAAGNPLEQVLARQDIFPDMYLTALSAGQRAGKVPEFLDRVSRILEKEVDNTLRRFVGLLEPMVILALGIIVGLFVLAVMGPIFDLTSGL